MSPTIRRSRPNSPWRRRPAPPPLRLTASWWTTPWRSAHDACSLWPLSISRGNAMDFSFSPEQEELRAHAKQLLDDVCPPGYAERCDTEARPPREAYKALAGRVWFALITPPEFGGTGGSAIALAILLEETGRHFEELAMWLFRTLTYGGSAHNRDGAAG